MKPLEPAKKAWLLTLDEEVAKTLPALSTSARHLLCAHGALESGWGVANAYRRGFNFGNLTAGPSWRGARWTDIGGDVNGAGEKITQVWRAYPTLHDAILDYWEFLGPNQNHGRYLQARKFLENADAVDFGIALSRAGYYELSVTEYLKRLGLVLQIVTQELA